MSHCNVCYSETRTTTEARAQALNGDWLTVQICDRCRKSVPCEPMPGEPEQTALF